MSWEDKPLPEDAEIAAAHPCRTDKHETYMEAMRLVGACHSKRKLVDLVNWLLARLETARAETENAKQCGHLTAAIGSSMLEKDGSFVESVRGMLANVGPMSAPEDLVVAVQFLEVTLAAYDKAQS